MKSAQLQPLEQLSPGDLALHVRNEITLHLSDRGAKDDRYCLELIRRVASAQDASAWTVLYAQFAPLVIAWLARSARGKEAMAVEGSDVLVNAAFTKLWMALRSGTKQFNSVGEFLSYLKLCTASVLADWWRELPITLLPGNESIADTSVSERDAPGQRAHDYRDGAAVLSDDPADEVIARLSFQELYEIVQSVLQDEAERAIGFLSLLCDLPPNAIFQERRDLFPSVDDVYRVKRNVSDRLRRNKLVRAHLHEKAGGETLSPHRAHSKEQHSGKEGITPSLPAGGDTERQRQELAQRELLALLDQRALSQARNDLLRIVEGQTQHIVAQTESCKAEGVSYSRRTTYCGKQHCRRCREGIGHGPYWYAYKSVNGRTVSVYLGKDLVPIPWDGDRPTFRNAKEREAPAQQKEPAVTYHRQVSYCGKQRCRRCREGIGHGPYWYAYRIVNGRTVRSYIGKIQPEEVPAPAVHRSSA